MKYELFERGTSHAALAESTLRYACMAAKTIIAECVYTFIHTACPPQPVAIPASP